MDEERIIKEFGHMWSTNKDEYVIVADPVSDGYTIYNINHHVMKIFENIEDYRYVLKKLIECDVELFVSLNALMEKYPPPKR